MVSNALLVFALFQENCHSLKKKEDEKLVGLKKFLLKKSVSLN